MKAYVDINIGAVCCKIFENYWLLFWKLFAIEAQEKMLSTDEAPLKPCGNLLMFWEVYGMSVRSYQLVEGI